MLPVFLSAEQYRGETQTLHLNIFLGRWFWFFGAAACVKFNCGRGRREYSAPHTGEGRSGMPQAYRSVPLQHIAFLYLGLFGYNQCVIDLNSKISHSALKF